MDCIFSPEVYNKILEICKNPDNTFTEELPQCITTCVHWKFLTGSETKGYCGVLKADWERGDAAINAEFLRKCKE